MVFPAGLQLRLDLDSFEAFEAAAVNWQIETTQLEPGAYRGRLRGAHTANLQVGFSWRSLGTHIRGAIPRGTYLLSLPVRWGGPMQFHGRPHLEGDLLIQDDARGLDFSSASQLEILTVAVSGAELTDRALAYWRDAAPAVLRRRVLRLKSAALANAAVQDLHAVLRSALAEPSGALGPRRQKEIENAALDALLARVDVAVPPSGAVERRRAGRRAAEFLVENWSAEISLADVCRATGAARRTVHEGFLELHGLPPMAFLRCVRLCRARRSLATGASVTMSATRCGFEHLGRFAETYRRFFGENPSETRKTPES
jgi:AraC family transcriptional regulator, ethanolamine operon transcriptional activator